MIILSKIVNIKCFKPKFSITSSIVWRGKWGITVLRYWAFCSSGISVIWILKCGIAVCGFSSFWLMVFGKRRSFTVLQYCLLRSSVIWMQVSIFQNGTWLHNFWQIIYDEIGRASFSIVVPINLRSSHVFSQWLRFISGLNTWDKQTREIDTTLSKRDRK